MASTIKPIIDANALEAMAKERPNEKFLKGSGVLKLIQAIRDLERANRQLRIQQPTPSTAPAFQQRVQPWLLECFGAEIAADRVERNHRFLEESLELVQALGCTASEAHQLVDYVFGRPVGDPPQEVGGVMVTLAALCLANSLDMHDAGEVELGRISAPELVAKIRAKQAAKPKHSPLPQSAAPQADSQPAPIDMVLHCPACFLQHIDAPDERTPGWKNEPHRSHLCHGCGYIWRPADVPTNGVAAVKTTGKADSVLEEAGLLDWQASARVEVSPEYEGPWHAAVFGEDEKPVFLASGNTPREALIAARKEVRDGR